MKNKIIGLALITLACIAAWLFLTFGPITKNLNKADFFRGFAIGFGLIAMVALVVALMKKTAKSMNPEKENSFNS